MKDKITKGMEIGEIVSKYPASVEILTKYGLHCIGRSVAAWETIERGAIAHGICRKELNNMLKELNKLKEEDKKNEKH